MAITSAHLLIIDDDALLRSTLQMMLKTDDYSVEAASGGEEGLEKALAEHPDLILLDYQMPDLNGIELLKRLRQDDWGKDARVLLMTNIYEVEVMNQLLQLGVNDYFLKADITMQKIKDEVARRLARH